MQFISIGQYFYKFYSILLLILLLPIFAFIAVYLALPEVAILLSSTALLLAMIALVLCSWLTGFTFFAKKIKSIRNRQGLGLKLEKYFYITIVRYMLCVTGCLILALGFYLTKDDLVTGFFVANLLALGLLWPTSGKVCNDLKLRGDEREMVFYKKDQLHK
jgi:hypothetical protein